MGLSYLYNGNPCIWKDSLYIEMRSRALSRIFCTEMAQVVDILPLLLTEDKDLHINGFVQECGNSNALAMELSSSWTKPSIQW